MERVAEHVSAPQGYVSLARKAWWVKLESQDKSVNVLQADSILIF